MAGIYVSNYASLVQFALFCNGDLTSTGVNTINEQTGTGGQFYYGTAPGAFGGTSTLYPGGPLVAAATTDLNSLISDIQTYAASLPALYQTVLPAATFAGPATFTPGAYYAAAGLTGTDVTLTFDGNNNPNSQFFIIVNAGVTFTRVQIDLINQAKVCNIFFLAGVGGTGGITFTGTSLSPLYNISGNLIAAGGAITTTDIVTIEGTMYALQDPLGAITITGDTDLISSYCTYTGGYPYPYPVPVCYLKGTKILTSKGYLPIEDLKAGDLVASKGRIYTDKCDVTKGHVLKHVVWTSKFGISELNTKTRPICIKAGALGDAPTEDLYVSPAHGIIVDGRMVAAKDLVNGTTIVQDTKMRAKDIVYHHLELENHSTVIANGVLSESMHGSKNRRFFEKSEVVYPKKGAVHMMSRPFSAMHVRR
jgi:hypothetical protein